MNQGNKVYKKYQLKLRWKMTIMVLLAAFSLAVFNLWILNSAPEGYEDEKGFHYGKEQDSNNSISNK
jgi:hypothetical protein